MASPIEEVNTKGSRLIDFPHHLRAFIQQMRADESSHDVAFAVENDRFPAHRCLVSAASPVLRTMLTNETMEANEGEVQLKEVSVTVWKVVLDYIYSAKIELPNAEEAVQVLECAERFQIEELAGVVSDYIERELDTSNCCQILAAVDCYHSKKLRDAAMKTIVGNFHEVRNEEGFSLLPFELVLEIIGCDKLVVRSELDVFVAVVLWFMRRVTSVVTEEPEDATAKGANEENFLARKVLSLFEEYEFVEPSLTQSNPLLFWTDGLEESNPIEHFKVGELLDCVVIHKLSMEDLRRVSGVCRKLCEEVHIIGNIEMKQICKFGETAIEKLVQLHNSIPNIPVPSYERVPHGRNDVLFTFSYRFHNVQDLMRSEGFHDSPEFADQFSMGKWSVKVYFRGYHAEVRDKYASCYLYRRSEDSAGSEPSKFGRQIFLDFGNSRVEHKEKLYYSSLVQDDTWRYIEGQGWGSSRLAPVSAFSGKNEVTVGVIIYFKSSDHY